MIVPELGPSFREVDQEEAPIAVAPEGSLATTLAKALEEAQVASPVEATVAALVEVSLALMTPKED